MSSMSIGGLASGLDTAGIISQLMQLEARPQTMLKTRVSTEQKVVTALQALNTKIATIATKAAELGKTSNWSPVTATSSNEAVSVKVSAGAAAATLSFTVDSVATSARASYATTGTLTTPVMAAGVEYYIEHDDPDKAPFIINTGDGTMRSVADGINKSGSGLTATLVRVGTAADGAAEYQLNVASTTTGANSGFTITEVDPANSPNPPATPTPFMGGATAVAGTDAQITVDGQATPLTSASNTFTGLMPGVDVTLQAGATGATTITVERDTASLTKSVKELVDLVNGVLDEIKTLTDSDPAAKKSGLLTGDSTMRSLRNQLLETVTYGIGGTSLATSGIEVDRTGKLVFDETTFTDAYTADPTGTTDMLAGTATSDGFADKLASLAKTFSDSTTGTLTLSLKNRTSQIRGLEENIASWDIRLANRRETLQRQYTALEVALGQLQSQGSWLSGQLDGLPKWS